MLMGQSGETERAVAPCPVLPEPVVMDIPSIPLPVVYLPMVNQNEIFLAGFRDCSQEAVRYLVEEERLSVHDPLITGLQEYLRAREAGVDVPAAVYQHVTAPAQTPQPYFSHYPYYPIYYPSQHVQLDTYKPLELELPCPPADISAMSDDSGLDDSMTSSLCEEEEEDEGLEDCDRDSGVSEHELAAGAMQLDELAQNNPGIGKLLNELFELYEEESDEESDVDEMEL